MSKHSPGFTGICGLPACSIEAGWKLLYLSCEKKLHLPIRIQMGKGNGVYHTLVEKKYKNLLKTKGLSGANGCRFGCCKNLQRLSLGCCLRVFVCPVNLTLKIMLNFSLPHLWFLALFFLFPPFPMLLILSLMFFSTFFLPPSLPLLAF